MPLMTLEQKVDSILDRMESMEQEISKLTLREFVQPATLTYVPATARCTCGCPGANACSLHGFMNNFVAM